jgi:hypothetical protein
LRALPARQIRLKAAAAALVEALTTIAAVGVAVVPADLVPAVVAAVIKLKHVKELAKRKARS